MFTNISLNSGRQIYKYQLWTYNFYVHKAINSVVCDWKQLLVEVPMILCPVALQDVSGCSMPVSMQLENLGSIFVSYKQLQYTRLRRHATPLTVSCIRNYIASIQDEHYLCIQFMIWAK